MEPIKTKTSVKDFFFHVGVMVTLYAASVSVISLLFTWIDKIFPDKLNSGYYYYDYVSSGVKMAIATLIVIYPIYLFLAWYMARSIRKDLTMKESGVHKFLVYVTLFLSAATIATDLIVLIKYFLDGEVSARFIWKVITVIIVAGLVLGYYIYDLRVVDRTRRTIPRLFIIASITLTLLALIGGFSIIGSPVNQRALRFDEQRTSNLSNIQSQIVMYWQNQGKLPVTLNDLEDSISGYKVPVDPSTDSPYVYSVTDKTSFQICAIFQTKSNMESTAPQYYNELNGTWTHEKGRTCFDRTIDPVKYPLRPKAGIVPVQN